MRPLKGRSNTSRSVKPTCSTDVGTDRLRLAICREISGFDDVSERFARSAFSRLEARHGTAAVEEMAGQYADHGPSRWFTDPAAESDRSCVIARELLGYLYTAELPDSDEVVEEDYFESLIWRAALAHPPALSGGYFGYWRYPPEESADA